MILVAVLPLSFPLVFGYAVACTRTSVWAPAEAPPSWRVCWRLVADGVWSALQAAVLTAPFAAGAWLLAGLLVRVWRPTGNAFPDVALDWIAALTVAAMPWGVAMLLVVPPTIARFAVTGRPADLAELRWVVRCVHGRYAEWNVVLVGITTAWALAAVGVAVAGVGVVPGAFYAILVSAHACSALAPDRTPG
ncbi:MAG TPA: DUF4013 domain-containing protein [Candidatus Dormibacteraeota bacterium]